MSVEDFEGMDCDEWEAVAEVWHEREEAQRQESWEQARIIGTLAVSPWVKGRVRPSRILPLPWDKATTATDRRRQRGKPEHTVSKEEDKARLIALMERIRKANNSLKTK